MRKNKIIENTSKGLFMTAAVFSILAVLAIVIFLLLKSIPALSKIGLFNFLFGTEWNSSSYDTFAEPLVGKYGILTMIVGSLFATAGALLIGGTLGYFTAVFLAKFCPRRLKKILSALINLLAGIPSVIYGFFGMKILLPLLGVFSDNGSGSGIFAVSIILGIMILPTIVALSKTSIEGVPYSYYEGARALGVSHEHAVFKAVVPAAKSGIAASFILGIGRAIGETMAVIMVAGNSVTIPNGLFASFRTMTANIVLEMGYAGEVQMSALIATGMILLFFIIIINFLFHLVANKKEKHTKVSKLVDKPKGKLSILRTKTVNFKKTIISCKTAIADFKTKLTAKLPKIKTEKFAKVFSFVSVTVATLALLIIIGFILINGLPHINWAFLSTDYTYGGKITIFPSIVTTLMLVFMCLIIAVPLGIMTAIFLNEYTKKGNKLVKLIRNAVDILAGIPSIVYGLFGMIFFCNILGLGTSITAGALTVTLMILPTIVRATEESLLSVPDSYREGSLALGATKLRTIFKVVLPCALPGILSAVVLSVGRVVSESAPLMFTMGASLKPLPTNGFAGSGTTLAVALYKLAGEGLHVNEAYATACVLIIIVLILNMLSSLIVHLLQRKSDGKIQKTKKGKKSKSTN